MKDDKDGTRDVEEELTRPIMDLVEWAVWGTALTVVLALLWIAADSLNLLPH
jgi:hypothetical protein